MSETRRNVLVGLFVVVGLAGMATLSVLFGQRPTWLAPRDTYALEIQFRSAGGIRTGNIVTVNGIEVGRVVSVGLYDPQRLDAEFNVRVVASIRNEFQIPDGSTAVTTEPVMGQGRPNLEIEPGPSTNPPLQAGARIYGRVLGAVEAIFPSHIVSTFTSTAEQIRITGQALTPVLQDLHDILEKRSPESVDSATASQGNLSSATARLDSMIKNLNEYVGQPDTKDQFRLTMSNIYEVSADAREVMTDLRAAAQEAQALVADARKTATVADRTLTNLEARFGEVGTRVNGSLTKVDQVVDTLGHILLPVSRGQGTIGKLFADNELYEAMVLTMRRLAAMITEYQALAKEWQKGKVRVGF